MKNNFNMKHPHSFSGIDYALKNRIQYTLKQMHKYPERRNNQNIRIQRRDYCSMLTARDISYGNNCIFIDESEFNLWLIKDYARSERELPAFQTMSSQKKRNISLMAAMSVNGVFLLRIIRRIIRMGVVIADYLIGLFDYLEIEKAFDQTLIMDSCRIHSSSEVKKVAERFSRHKIIFLPFWSPFLNPIKELFSKLKISVKNEHWTKRKPCFKKSGKAWRIFLLMIVLVGCFTPDLSFFAAQQ